MSMRYKLPPGGDCPPIAAARRLWMTLEEFEERLPELLTRGFPRADPTSGNYDIDAIDAWRRTRYPHLFGRSGTATSARDANDVVRSRMAGRQDG